VQSLVADFFVVTSSFQLYFLRPVSEGYLLARGQVVSRSKRLYIAEGVLLDNRGKEVARGTGTFMPSSIQLGSELGYR
jgi:acyl-coenzyme A thioesterase PaaI-like protein